MRFQTLLRSLLLTFVALVVMTPAHADTYHIYSLDSDEARWVRALAPDGTVVLSYDVSLGTTCDPSEPGCFRTYIDGVLTSTSNTLPTVTDDSGTPCTPSVPSGATVKLGVCNNGYEAWIGYMTPDQIKPALYTGTDPSSALPWQTGGFLYVNSKGDVVWNDPNRELWLEAIDLDSQDPPSDPAPVPEPGSLALLGTGALAALSALPRRIRL